MRKLIVNTYANVFEDDGVTVKDTVLVRTQTLEAGSSDPKDPAAHMYYEPDGKEPRTTYIEVVDVDAHAEAALGEARISGLPA